MSDADHWDEVYRSKEVTAVSWYQPSPEPSLQLLERFGAGPESSFIDVGGGASTLVDVLIERGWPDLTILDIAAPALEASQTRLGEASDAVTWKVADIVTWEPPRRYDIWHDRAVFHFLTKADDRESYRRALIAGTKPDSLVIMATFALNGPERCSGLIVQRYSSDTLLHELGSSFDLLTAQVENHTTPGGSEQVFNWCVLKRNA